MTLLLKTVTTLSIAVAISASAYSATLNIGGTSFVPFNGQDGANLPDGSIIQLGYFLGLDPQTDPSTFDDDQWNLFTPILGIGAPISDSRNIATDFGTGEFDLGIAFDTEVDSLPAFPVRIAVRIFDSTTTIDDQTFFNTLSSNTDDWILELPQGTPITPGTGRADLNIDSAGQADLFFQDNDNRFATSIQPIPEPGTSLTAFLGAALLLGARRRK